MENVLQLLLACLTFDFIGTAPEESTDDTGTLQIPTAWRPGMFACTSSTVLVETPGNLVAYTRAILTADPQFM